MAVRGLYAAVMHDDAGTRQLPKSSLQKRIGRNLQRRGGPGPSTAFPPLRIGCGLRLDNVGNVQGRVELGRY